MFIDFIKWIPFWDWDTVLYILDCSINDWPRVGAVKMHASCCHCASSSHCDSANQCMYVKMDTKQGQLYSNDPSTILHSTHVTYLQMSFLFHFPHIFFPCPCSCRVGRRSYSIFEFLLWQTDTELFSRFIRTNEYFTILYACIVVELMSCSTQS